MRDGEIEAKTLGAVDTVRRGGRIEDDLVECKAKWPDVDQGVRQLAATCNQARGSEVLLIIGLDEKTGEFGDLDHIDPAAWWLPFEARFDDQVAPELTRHLRVRVDDEHEVIALVFDTARIPYVLKTGHDKFQREIVIRTATTTRSAKRHEILRLLAPTISLPTITLLDADLTFGWTNRASDPGPRLADGSPPPSAPERAWLGGVVDLYIEHLVPDFVMIPTHRIQVAVEIAGFTVPAEPRIHSSKNPAPQYGVDRRNDGLLVTGPGRAHLNFSADVSPEQFRTAEMSPECTVRLTLNVDGGAVPIRLSGVLTKQTEREEHNTSTVKQIRFVRP